jgi:phage tail-like protein
MANGHGEFFLDERSGWRAALLDHTVAEDTLRLRPLPGIARPLVDAAGSFGELALPTGLALDQDDRIYILDGPAHVIKRYDPCSEAFEVLPCIGGLGNQPRQLWDPHGLAISCRGDLYVADTGNRRVQVFALKGLALRQVWGPLKVTRGDSLWRVEPARLSWQIDVAAPDCQAHAVFAEGVWQPYDIALSGGGRAYVTDYANGLVHVFDPHGCWRTAYDGVSATSTQLEKPTHIAVDTDGRLYVVQEGKDFVTVLDADGNFLQPIRRADEVRGDFCPFAVGVDADGNIYISDRVARRVYCVDKRDEDRCACAEALPGPPTDCTTIAFDRFGNPLLGDGQNKCVVRRQAKTAYEGEGRYYSEPLDSRTYQCLWHQVIVRASIPPGVQLRVDACTAESPKSTDEIQSMPEDRWATGQVDAQVGEGEWDCLILSPPGRYLWLRLTLTGDGSATPAVQWVRVVYPRLSSLRYLPAAYSENAESRDFLGRFLSIFDTVRDGITEGIASIARYFDPGAAPAAPGKNGRTDFLSWLASWLDLSLDRHWPEPQRRALVRNAHRLYALRGTPAGLRLHLHLHTGLEPQILEHFKLRRWLFVGHARLGDQSALYGNAIVGRLQLDEYSRIGAFRLVDSGDPLRDPFHVYAHQFTVFVPLRSGGDRALQQQTVERIVEMAKPAHTQARVNVVEPRFRIGVQAFLGVDTIIGQYPDHVIAGRGRLGYDTLLGPSADEAAPPAMRIGMRTRIGSSTVIN